MKYLKGKCGHGELCKPCERRFKGWVKKWEKEAKEKRKLEDEDEQK